MERGYTVRCLRFGACGSVPAVRGGRPGAREPRTGVVALIQGTRRKVRSRWTDREPP